MSQSPAASVMSSIHAGSQISMASSLPDDYGRELSKEQMLRFQNIPSNIHQGNKEIVLKELVPLIIDSDEVDINIVQLQLMFKITGCCLQSFDAS